MSFNSAVGRTEYIALGGQTSFDFVFKIYTDEDIKIWLTPSGDLPDDTADLLVLHTDYEVTLNGDDGGWVVLTTPATAGDLITIVRSLAANREIEYQVVGKLRPEVLNMDQNYQTYLISDGLTAFDRTFRLPENTQGISLVLPAPLGDSYIKWSADGTYLENDTTIPDAVITSAANAAAAAASAALAGNHEDGAELEKWNAEAHAMTSESYATEGEGDDVNVYTSDGDGTFTATPQVGVRSAFHWALDAAASAASINLPILTSGDVGKFPVVNATYDGYDLSEITESEIVTKTDNQALHDTDAIEFRESGTVSYIDLNKGDGSTETIGFTRQYVRSTGTITSNQTLELTAPSGYSFCDLSSHTDDDSGQEAGVRVVGIALGGTSVSILCSPAGGGGTYSVVWSKFISA